MHLRSVFSLSCRLRRGDGHKYKIIVIRVMDDGFLRFRNSKCETDKAEICRANDLAKIVRIFLIVAIAYYLGAEIAFLVGTLSDRIFAPFWPPNVVLFCALVLTPPRQWWIYIVAVLPAHIAAELRVGMPATQLLVAFVTNCSVAVINAFALRWLKVESPWFGTIRKATAYVFVTAFVGPALCAFGGAFVQILGGGSIEHYGIYWARWYASNALGSLTLGPIALICLEKYPFSLVSPRGALRRC
jgi:integral membrane sensor domain MASE1